MGIFSRKKGKEAPEPAPKAELKPKKRVPDPEELIDADVFKVFLPKEGDEPDTEIYQSVNLTEKMVKIDVPYRERREDARPEEGLDYVALQNVYLWEEEGLIRGMQGDDVVFEVTKRSKSYGELLPYVRHKAKRVSIWQETSSYGKYYRARLWFDAVRAE